MGPNNQQPQQTSGPQPPVVPSFQPQQPPQDSAGVDPGHGLGLASLITSFFIGILGLILGIVALMKSKKAGYKNGLALAGIIVGSINTILIIIFIILSLMAVGTVVSTVSDAVKEGGGTVTIDGPTTGGSTGGSSTTSAKAVIDDLYANLNDQDFETMGIGSSISSSDGDSISINPNNKDFSDSGKMRVNGPIVAYIDGYFSEKGFTKQAKTLSDNYISSSVTCNVDHADFMQTIGVDCSDNI